MQSLLFAPLVFYLFQAIEQTSLRRDPSDFIYQPIVLT